MLCLLYCNYINYFITFKGTNYKFQFQSPLTTLLRSKNGHDICQIIVFKEEESELSAQDSFMVISMYRLHLNGLLQMPLFQR